MRLTSEEENYFLEKALEEFKIKFNRENRTDNLKGFLEDCGLFNTLEEYEQKYERYEREPKYAVIGTGTISKKEIYSIFEAYGVEKENVYVELDFLRLKKLDIEKFKNNEYKAIFVGGIQHSTVSKGIYSSPIVRMEQEYGFPYVARICSGRELCITESELKYQVDKYFNDL